MIPGGQFSASLALVCKNQDRPIVLSEKQRLSSAGVHELIKVIRLAQERLSLIICETRSVLIPRLQNIMGIRQPGQRQSRSMAGLICGFYLSPSTLTVISQLQLYVSAIASA